MILNQTFELSMILDSDRFQRLFNAKVGYLEEIDDEYLDTSLAAKGITAIYRDSRYKKKIRLLVNAGMVVDNPSGTDRLKLSERPAQRKKADADSLDAGLFVALVQLYSEFISRIRRPWFPGGHGP